MSGRTKHEVVFEQVVAPALERAPGMTGRPGTRKTVPPSGRSTEECSSELDSGRLERASGIHDEIPDKMDCERSRDSKPLSTLHSAATTRSFVGATLTSVARGRN